ncbi:sigma-70 family RNA polymerase sigma factor [Paenibacillus sp. XY044]|uniref:sigma-70 family RNA polymerase sigma factor n=1 Tax=Paenibacillus sp. XY044 TaxID=2026089 RepID=UPI000B99A805|nr:sigma-70 family RNA polymerase sigma factor [Paenibacillus sp. XY044]OZB95021.1 hypothetical protein CJP46_15060 [Paenibacillus sp. XY044]
MIDTAPYSSFPGELAGFLADLRPQLLKYCLSLTRREWEAEDLVQDTMVRMMNRCTQMPEITLSKPYVFRTARNLWIDRCRSSRRLVSMPVEQFESAYGTEPESFADPLITRDLLEELMYRLKPKAFVMVLLCDVFGFTAKEAGNCINMAEVTVQVALSRARKRLRLLALEQPDGIWNDACVLRNRQGDHRSAARLLEAVTTAFIRHDPRLIYDAYLRVYENGCRMDIRTRDGRLYFTFQDPDGNAFMVSETF